LRGELLQRFLEVVLVLDSEGELEIVSEAEPVLLEQIVLAGLEEAGCGSGESVGALAAVVEEDGERRRRADLPEPSFETADEHRLGSLGLGSPRSIGPVDLDDHGYPVAFRDRLAEAAPTRHVAQF